MASACVDSVGSMVKGPAGLIVVYCGDASPESGEFVHRLGHRKMLPRGDMKRGQKRSERMP